MADLVSFAVIPEGFTFPCLIGNLYHLSSGIIAIAYDIPISIGGGSDISSIIVCICFPASVCMENGGDPAPGIQFIFCPVSVAVGYPSNVYLCKTYLSYSSLKSVYNFLNTSSTIPFSKYNSFIFLFIENTIRALVIDSIKNILHS